MIKYNQSGWLEGVRHCPSPNYDERPAATVIDLLVVHGISLPPGEYGGEHIDQLFTNSLDPDDHPYFRDICNLRVSSHVLIRRSGEIIQYVPLNKRAWHAGVSSFRGRTCCNDFSVGIELEGCDDHAYEAVQYTKLVMLCRIIMSHWPQITLDHIVGHSDIAPGRKTDPGPAFNWEYFRNLLKNE